MKKLDGLGISPAPWNVKHHPEESSDEFEVFSADGKYVGPIAIGYGISKSMANFIAAAPNMYEQLRRSTNMIEHSIQFVKNADIKNALRKLADENKSALAKAAGEETK